MKKIRAGHYFLILFFAGFLTGIFYGNYNWENHSDWTGIFTETFWGELGNTRVVLQKYIWYLLYARVFLCAVLVLMVFLRIRKIMTALFIIWTGTSGGILLSEAVTQLGMKGSLLCIAGILPQSLFYIPAAFIFLKYCWNYPQSQWNRQKTRFVCILFLLGILSEIYLNPCLIQWMARHLF